MSTSISNFPLEINNIMSEINYIKENSIQYQLCELYYFRHPTLKKGFQPANGGLIDDAANKYPKAWTYLQTTEGQLLCKTEEEWQAMSTATWHTLADNTKIGFDGVGGVPYFVQDLNAGTLRLMDVSGMHAEASGGMISATESLDVGGVSGDMIREIAGISRHLRVDNSNPYTEGALTLTKVTDVSFTAGSGQHAGDFILNFLNSRVVPVGPTNRPKSYGVLACVYLGR